MLLRISATGSVSVKFAGKKNSFTWILQSNHWCLTRKIIIIVPRIQDEGAIGTGKGSCVKGKKVENSMDRAEDQSREGIDYNTIEKGDCVESRKSS